MKKTKSLLCLFAAVLLLLSGCRALNADEEVLKFKKVDSGWALYRYTGSTQKTSFTVPDEHEGEKVVEIMDFAIANVDAEYLETIFIGENIQKIGDWGINNCVKLQKIEATLGNPTFASKDGILYSKDMTTLLAYPNEHKDASGAYAFVLPESVTKIANNAFYQCKNLESITFNEGLREIGDKAFIKCEKLQSFTLPQTLTHIGTDAFSYCDSLEALTLPANIQSIGDYAFFSLSSGIKTIVVQRASLDGITVGKDWIPTLQDSANKKAEISYQP